VLEIIPIDMERERCEAIALICLQLLFSVTWKDVMMKMLREALKITNEIQIDVEVGVPN
jgi:hypothetical protein